MTAPSPLLAEHQRADALLLDYGPAEAPIRVVGAFDQVAVEYASIRKNTAIIDLPHRGVIEVTGDDRFGFLNRMVTQELKDLTPGRSTCSFWLSRQGRIESDLRLVRPTDDAPLLIDLDAHAVERTIRTLEAYIIAEDVTLTDAGERWHRLALHGPGACELLADNARSPDARQLLAIRPDTTASVEIDGIPLIVDRRDTAGRIGLELFVPSGDVERVYNTLSAPSPQTNLDPNTPPTPFPDQKARRVGWHAYNLARIEAGTPIFNVDFGTDSLPAETSLLESRVSFTKGCYLGQEVVARMHSLGHPAKRIVTLTPVDNTAEWDVTTGTSIRDSDKPDSKEIGVVTSSGISPMNSGTGVCFAMVKWKHSEPGTRLWARTPTSDIAVQVRPKLAVWSNAGN